MSEDIVGEKNAGWSIELVHAPMQMVRELETRPLRVYTKSVNLYTARNLTDPADILHAFEGIGNRIGNALGGPLLFGLPTSHFDWVLLWEPCDAAQRRTMTNAVFPSWSWSGWTGATMEYKLPVVEGCLINLYEWLMEHTWIVWYIRDDDGSLRLVWTPGAVSDDNQKLESRWRGYKARDKGDDTHDEYGRPTRPEKGPPRPEVFHRTLPEYPGRPHVSTSHPQGEPQSLDPYLQFWTWSAFLRLAQEDNPSDSELGSKQQRLSITDNKGDWCGTIVLDREWCRNLKPDSIHEFIAISDAKNFDMKEYAARTYYIESERDQSEWDLYYVLLIEYEGPKKEVAHRVGLGKVYQTAFDNSCNPGKDWRVHPGMMEDSRLS